MGLLERHGEGSQVRTVVLTGRNKQAFRFNNRKDNDAGRFVSVLKSIVNKRLTYTELTGQELPQTC